MKAFKNAISALMSIAMLSGMLIACSDTQPDSQDDVTSAEAAVNTTAPTETESLYDANGYLKDDLGNFDYGKKNFTLLYWSDREHEEFFAEDQSGEPVNDAIYQRNLNVEQRCNIELCFDSTKGNASNIAAFTTKLETAINSGDNSYDMIGVYSITAGNCAVKGLLYDLNTCTNFEWDKPWWPENLISQATINDKLFFASGDISANTIYMMYVTFFNKELAENRNIGNIYDLVNNGTWTLDKMIELSTGIYEDADASGAPSLGDLYGTYTYTLHLDAFLVGAGITFVSSSDGEMTINPDFTSEKAVNLVDKLSKFHSDTNSAYLITKNSNVTQWFSAGKCLFWTDRCRSAIKFKDADASFGVVPVPKGDTDQENYYSVLGNPFSLYCLPCDTKDEAYASSVMEIYASESYRTVSPTLYETTMKYRYTDDATSAEMFDIVRSSVTFDIGRLFGSNFSSPYGSYEKTVQSGASWKTMSATYSKKIWPSALETILASFQ